MVGKEEGRYIISCVQRGAISRLPVWRVRQPENIRGHGYSLVMCASCSFQGGNRFSIPCPESPPKRKNSPTNHNPYSDEVLGGQPGHTHRRIPYSIKTLTAVDDRKTMVVLNPYFFEIPNPPLSHHTLSTF